MRRSEPTWWRTSGSPLGLKVVLRAFLESMLLLFEIGGNLARLEATATAIFLLYAVIRRQSLWKNFKAQEFCFATLARGRALDSRFLPLESHLQSLLVGLLLEFHRGPTVITAMGQILPS
ncbi:hypothetical protein Nepgr_012292 [Nepenthes gracilis]|uniref:Uncharacterized protein n=1 Tax=Nepenthes gracilis TaxID=150966 RepID=A0AAD3SHA0_NEPGR|nr:hypothetical protein Nepgr_012292 [Nepenthes gracilis]